MLPLGSCTSCFSALSTMRVSRSFRAQSGQRTDRRWDASLRQSKYSLHTLYSCQWLMVCCLLSSRGASGSPFNSPSTLRLPVLFARGNIPNARAGFLGNPGIKQPGHPDCHRDWHPSRRSTALPSAQFADVTGLATAVVRYSAHHGVCRELASLGVLGLSARRRYCSRALGRASLAQEDR